MSTGFHPTRPMPEVVVNLSQLPEWARMTYADLQAAAAMVGAQGTIDELVEDYLALEGPEQRCWPARLYWRELVAHMGTSRRRNLALARLWPEFMRFRQGRRSPGCTEIRGLLLAGGRPRGLDCLHAARCEHCRMFALYINAS